MQLLTGLMTGQLDGHMSGAVNSGFLTTKQLHCLLCTMSQCIVLLKDVNISYSLDGWQ